MLRRVLLVFLAPACVGLFGFAPALASAEGCANEARRVEQHSTYLPDCRAYEMVSPPDKNGAGVMRSSRRTQAAVGGEALKFSSLAAFGDAQGTGVATEYLSRRTGAPGTQGWATHAITPRLDPLSLQSAAVLGDPGYLELSPDLSSGLYRGYTNLTGDPDVEQVQNIYLRTDLFEAGAGSYELLSACPVCGGVPLPKEAVTPPAVDDSSADQRHIIFESHADLLPGASGERPKLYEWDHGTLRLAGILPESEGGEVAERSRAGQGGFNHLNTLSDGSDGHSRIFFTTGSQEGPLYMRVDATTTVRIDASERTEPEAEQPALYQTASADGERVFFLSSGALTDDAPPSNGLQNLYMYDASKPASDPHHLTLIAAGGEHVGVLGVSADGRYVYFTDIFQLVSGAPALNGELGFFVWHDGVVSYIGSSSGPATEENTLEGIHGAGARVTPDGKSVLFIAYSGDGLTGYDHGNCNGQGCSELYLYHAPDAKLVCVSCSPSGAAARSNASFFSEVDTGGSLSSEAYRSHPLSDDGRYVFFQTAEALVPEDTNGEQDVYEYDAVTGAVHLISSGKSDVESNFLDASTDGKDVFFATAEPLLGWDADANYDFYDARVGGGFPEPPAASAACEGDACHGAASAPASVLSAGSVGLEGSGNVAGVPAAKSKPKSKPKAPVCRRGSVRRKVKGKVRCVKRKRQPVKRAKTSGRGK